MSQWRSLLDAHDWLSEKKLGDTDELVLRQRKEMKGLQAKVKDLQCAKAEEKKRLQRIIVNREDTIDQLKYDLRVLDRTHRDLQTDYKKLNESMKCIRKQEEELKERDKQKLLARQKQEVLQHDIKERVRIEETERVRAEMRMKRQQEKEFESFKEFKRKRV